MVIKNIVWLNQFALMQDEKDIGPDKTTGGAEITIDTHIKFLKSKGLNVELMTPRSLNMDKIKECDLVIMSNIIFGYLTAQGQWYINNRYDGRPDYFKIEDLDYIVNNKTYINMEHDLKWHWRRNETIDLFPETHNYKPYWWAELIKNAKLNVFLSPLQIKPTLRYFFKYIGTEKYNNAIIQQIRKWENDDWHNQWKSLVKDNITCIPPPVKKDIISPSPTAMIKGTYGVVGAIYPGKGIEDILLQFKELGKNLRFIGKVADGRLQNMIIKQGHTIVPPVPYKDMPKILQKYEYIILSRRIPKSDINPDGAITYYTDEKGKQLYDYMNEGFGRIVPEALNVGCKILIDKESKKRFGAYSYGWTDQEIIDNCDKADETFYNELISRKIINGK